MRWPKLKNEKQRRVKHEVKLYVWFKNGKKEKSTECHNHVVNPWQQEEEEGDTSRRGQNKQTHEKYIDQLSHPKAKWSQC